MLLTLRHNPWRIRGAGNQPDPAGRRRCASRGARRNRPTDALWTALDPRHGRRRAKPQRLSEFAAASAAGGRILPRRHRRCRTRRGLGRRGLFLRNGILLGREVLPARGAFFGGASFFLAGEFPSEGFAAHFRFGAEDFFEGTGIPFAAHQARKGAVKTVAVFCPVVIFAHCRQWTGRPTVRRAELSIESNATHMRRQSIHNLPGESPASTPRSEGCGGGSYM